METDRVMDFKQRETFEGIKMKNEINLNITELIYIPA